MSQYSNHLFTPGTENNSWAHLYEYIKKGDRVLDVGCSSGNFGEALIALKQCEVVGIDLDEADIKLASKKLSKAFVADINDKSIYKELGAYDVIIFADVIEHLVDPRGTMKNIRTLLKKDGRVIFSIPHMAHSSVRLGLLAGKFPYKERGLLDRTHLHFYDREEFESVFSDAGYNLVKVNPVVSHYPQRLLNSKLEAAGLKVTKKFEDFLEKTDGNIFQFVGYAMPTEHTKTRKVPPYVMPQDEVYDLAQAVLTDNTELKKIVEELQAQNAQLGAALQKTNSKLVAKLRRRARKLITKK